MVRLEPSGAQWSPDFQVVFFLEECHCHHPLFGTSLQTLNRRYEDQFFKTKMCMFWEKVGVGEQLLYLASINNLQPAISLNTSNFAKSYPDSCGPFVFFHRFAWVDVLRFDSIHALCRVPARAASIASTLMVARTSQIVSIDP